MKIAYQGYVEEEIQETKRCRFGSSLFLCHSSIYNEEGHSLAITITTFSIVMLMETQKSEWALKAPKLN